jgi:nucleotide-binding universal stress UspA family protein
MFANIVVGTDGSPTAREAVRQAAELAKATGANLHIVTAYRSAALLAADPLALGPSAVQVETQLRNTAHEIVQGAARDADGLGVKAETYAVSGDPSSCIIEVAETQGADLIVVGSRGMTGARRFLLGSVPSKVAHHAPCYVLIVRTV